MRGTTNLQVTMLSTLTSDSLIPADHPIRRIKPVVEAVLAELEPERGLVMVHAEGARHLELLAAVSAR